MLYSFNLCFFTEIFSHPFSLEEESSDDEDDNYDNEEEVRNFYALEMEMDEYDEMEMDEEVGFLMNKHHKCAAHTLQLVLKDVFQKNAEMMELRKVSL
jgi:hypothetical protein